MRAVWAAAALIVWLPGCGADETSSGPGGAKSASASKKELRRVKAACDRAEREGTRAQIRCIRVGIADKLSSRAKDRATHPLGVALGSKRYAPGGDGFGTVKPRRIHNGGVPSGLVVEIRWEDWGESAAHGRGLTYLYKPRGGYYAEPGEIVLKAHDLGRFPGSRRRAYRQLRARTA